MPVKTNGTNGHGKRDAGVREPTIMPCSTRLDNGGWCVLPVGHQEACDGPARRLGPEPSIWHQCPGRKIACGKIVSDPVTCNLPRGHTGACQ